MLDYRFRAVGGDGRIVRGTLPAAHEAHLAELLLAQGYELLTCRAPKPLRRLWQTSLPRSEVALLFTQLAALAEAGVPLRLCLSDTLQSLPTGALRDALGAVTQEVQRGASLAEACATQPQLFPRSLIAVLEAGMAGGSLAQGFARARDHVQWQAEFGALLRRATRYPLFLLALCIGVISFMMLLVVPELAAFLKAQNYALPWHSLALFWIAEQFAVLWWLMPLLLAAGAGVAVFMRRHSAGFALWSDGVLLRLPLFGKLLRQRESAVFLHHLALLVGGGVPVLTALSTARGALNNRALQQETERMIAAVTAGEDLASVWQKLPSFGGLIARRAQIGLQTGTLPAQLQQASEECDAAVISASKQLIGALEPALTLLVGALLGWIVLAVLGPLYGALGTLGAGR